MPLPKRPRGPGGVDRLLQSEGASRREGVRRRKDASSTVSEQGAGLLGPRAPVRRPKVSASGSERARPRAGRLPRGELWKVAERAREPELRAAVRRIRREEAIEQPARGGMLDAPPPGEEQVEETGQHRRGRGPRTAPGERRRASREPEPRRSLQHVPHRLAQVFLVQPQARRLEEGRRGAGLKKERRPAARRDAPVPDAASANRGAGHEKRLVFPREVQRRREGRVLQRKELQPAFLLARNGETLHPSERRP